MAQLQQWIERCKQAFDAIEHSVVDGISGVIEFKGKDSGSQVGITICTHGNEPVGLAMLWYLLENPQLIKRGRLLVALNNVAATKLYLESDCEIIKAGCRGIDENMNRLPECGENMSAYEYARAQELKPIWKQFIDGGLDIHSTSSDTPPLAIIRNDDLSLPQNQKIVDNMPLGIVLTGAFSAFCGKPVVDCFGNETSSRILYECGQHCQPDSFNNTITYALSWLSAFDMLNKHQGFPSCKIATAHYHIVSSAFIPDDGSDYRYYEDKMIMPLQKIDKGQILAVSDNGNHVTAPEFGYAFMAPQTSDILPAGEELLFIAQKQCA